MMMLVEYSTLEKAENTCDTCPRPILPAKYTGATSSAGSTCTHMFTSVTHSRQLSDLLKGCNSCQCTAVRSVQLTTAAEHMSSTEYLSNDMSTVSLHTYSAH
jgi:hypothetical protein